MDSTPTQSHLLSLTSSSSSSPRKLPIKRKTPNPNPPILESDDALRRPSPLKFHRIWTEPDEIRFLQGLLDASSQSLSFPRDLTLFYDRFSTSVSRPYSKSQLSEKLRRLRKKWRVVSARIDKGLDPRRLSPHDQALFHLSNQLWHPESASKSAFGVKVSFSPSIGDFAGNVDLNDEADCCYEDVKLSLVECGGEEEEEKWTGDRIGKIVAKSVVDAFDESLKDVKFKLGKRLCYGGEGSFEKRWRELRVAEMEVLAQRFRLLVEDRLL